MISYRNLAFLALVCVGFVVAALVVKISQSLPPARALPTVSFANRPILKVAPDFFKTGRELPKTVIMFPTSPTATIPKPDKYGITAASYILGNLDTGKIYIERNASDIVPVASMSKLITAVAATDTLTPTTTIEITPDEASVPPDTSNLRIGERFTAEELLYPLLMSSSNVAAEALASTTAGRSKFLELMSGYAWEVGMPGTYFADPSGVDPKNVSSAKDFFALAQYLYHSRPDILAITRVPQMSMATTSDHGSHEVISTHPFVIDARFIGGKTGRTPQAGDTMLTLLRVNGQAIAIVVLGSHYNERADDTTILVKQAERLVK